MNNIKNRPLWWDEKSETVKVIDQRRLPHEFVTADLKTVDDVIRAIKEMFVRGAPLIGVTGAYGVYLALYNSDRTKLDANYIVSESARIKSSRPTAVNLAWAVDQTVNAVLTCKDSSKWIEVALREAHGIAEFEVENCKMIGEHGVLLIEEIYRKKGQRKVNILTHCNAGWLACIEHGTATAPIYEAFRQGMNVHVWVDETRPLNQGARLTAWELGERGIKHTVIADNTGGYLMQQGMVDIVIVGTDRTTHTGDVANKIGTYLKALAAKDNNIPFYVALPSSTFDWKIKDGINNIPIEERDPDEIRFIQGSDEGRIISVLVPPVDSPAANFAFDVTPARLVTGFITERGVCKASENDIRRLFPKSGG